MSLRVVSEVHRSRPARPRKQTGVLGHGSGYCERAVFDYIVQDPRKPASPLALVLTFPVTNVA